LSFRLSALTTSITDGNSDEHSPLKCEYITKSRRLEWGIFGLVGDASPLDFGSYPFDRTYGTSYLNVSFTPFF